jgi:ElaB/YqjD/DUF883 family membrane-anchored ribosome-binding protein
MRTQLETIITKLEALLSRAEEYCDSENENTAERYADVPSNIEAALDALREAVEALTTD